jgi:predicted aspartyl protease
LAIKGLTASIKSFLASNPIGWAVLGISAITGVIYAINKHNKKLEEARQEIIDAGETARSEISQTKSDLEDLTSSATDAIETYSSLVNGINTVNNTNVKLSSDEYDEFIESSDKLGELFPELITGLDDEGHYILN